MFDRRKHGYVAFLTRLGFKSDPIFTDETAACMIVAENIFVMRLTEAKFKSSRVLIVEEPIKSRRNDP